MTRHLLLSVCVVHAVCAGWPADPPLAVSPACATLRQQYHSTNISALFALPVVNLTETTKLQFLHIPKNAGTTIAKSFPKLPIRDINYNRTRNKGCSNWHLPPSWFIPNPYKDYKVFCVIRNPVDKAISEFKMRHEGTLNQVDTVNRLEKWLTATSRWNGGGIDCHMVAQHEYVWDKNRTRTCDYLLRYENNLFQHYNDLLDAYPKRYRGSKMKTESSQQPHYLHHEVLTYPLTPSNLSDSVVRSVEQYYWMDMCLFGYDTSIEPPSSKL